MNALEGIKVVSFNHFLMGPAGMQVLGDLGADVIAVEPVGGSFQRQWGGANRKVDGESLLFLCANRNKRSMALDLKSESGMEVARKLATGADVVAENFRPGVMDRLGLGYESIKAENPRCHLCVCFGLWSGRSLRRPTRSGHAHTRAGWSGCGDRRS